MKKNSQSVKSQGNGAVASFFADFGKFVKLNFRVILVVSIGFIVASILNYLNVSLKQTVAAYHLEDFEVGQIADTTIYAPKSFSADEENPVFIEEGEKIIRKGFPITEESMQKLEKLVNSPVYIDFRMFANSEIYLLLIVVMSYLFFLFLPRKSKVMIREYIFQLICFLLVYASSAFGSRIEVFQVAKIVPYALNIVIPAAMFVLIQAILYGQLSAIFFSILLSFGVLNASGYEIVPFLYTLASCLAATSLVRKIERRIDMVLVSIVIAFVDAVIVFLLCVIFNEKFNYLGLIIGGCAANGFLSGILALGFITPVEFLLNTASVFRLMDLSDLNNSVMRKMLITASGTYQHSQMVAQLAETACRDIGADSLLARVGAYYHDIGKMEQSEYFVENQSNGINKHNDIKPSMSVSVIRSHVRKGVEKARQLHLPFQVINIIEEHHGNSLIAYFYEEAKKLDPNVNPADYSYTGKPPSTKESAVVMIADTVEAACRTLDNPNEERLDKFIQTLISSKIEHHQLDNCDLTFSDITKIRSAFVKLLVGYYHTRIEYPDQKDPDKEEDEKSNRSERTDSEKTSRVEKNNSEKSRRSERGENESDRTKSKKVLSDKTLEEARINGQ